MLFSKKAGGRNRIVFNLEPAPGPGRAGAAAVVARARPEPSAEARVQVETYFFLQGRRLVGTALVLALISALAPLAQADGAPPSLAPAMLTTNAASAAAVPGQPVAVSGITLRQAWASGGWIMWVLAAMALTGVVLLIRQLPVFRDNYIAPRGLLLEVLERIRAGELSEARRLCEDRPCPLSAIALKTFDHLRHAPKAGVILLRDSVEAEGARQADVMLAQVQLMLDIAVIAPMFGLLGTVLGLLQVFGPAAQDAGSVRAVLQSGGIVQALATTAFGLFVAIPAMACHAWMRRRVSRRIAAIESAAAEIVMAVAGRYDR